MKTAIVTGASKGVGLATVKHLSQNGYKVIGLSASSSKVMDAMAEQQRLNFKFYFCDETALKTIVRSNPGVLELNKLLMGCNNSKSIR